ncbi:5-formyltetrahydrofolate cyclo-ligase [Jeotgalibacillus sp. ET6]|uniref:5-formyltetrahydrofolate cyclo-ligase n=1 Tax=Jeotgalibacillus sp. ET6 TaxID=3037260 RepID=UPI0024187D0F|nr:5-formyltetrahydrofolate cyclo-ligase [Jeotgalibacillus sp. ET6]MDG5470807.1 5-formyltetrahydrofolate cyclo-ligase [Jeotgalibacillus sp. ET6]
MNKHELRKQMSLILKKNSDESIQSRSKGIQEKLYQTNVWKQSKSIGITISRFPEVDTYSIIRRAWEEGKMVSVPKCQRVDRSMSFYRIQSFTEVEPSFFGLLEPVNSLESIASSQIDLMIVPGLAYTKKGYRLGYGGGYYDRYLQNYKGATVSLCFDEQLIENVPVEPHDQPIELVIGESYAAGEDPGYKN